MSHFAALAAQTDDGWHSTEVELDGLADIDEVADVMRDASVDDGPVLLFVEEDDEWFAIVRVDGVGEPRTFISDARVVPGSELAALVYEEEAAEDVFEEPESSLDEDDEDVELDEEEEPATRADAEPRGATDVLADLGIPAAQLLAMCAEEGMLPADVITAVCERLGCAEEIEVYRWTTASDESLMRLALEQAVLTTASADVPVGAIVVDADGDVVGVGRNARELTGDPTAHAEVLALRAASAALGTWRLSGCTLVVTLEPCTMCAGALVLARISRVVFGALDPKAGAVGSLWDVVRDRRLNHRPEVVSGVLADECGELLRAFFEGRRGVS